VRERSLRDDGQGKMHGSQGGVGGCGGPWGGRFSVESPSPMICSCRNGHAVRRNDRNGPQRALLHPADPRSQMMDEASQPPVVEEEDNAPTITTAEMCRLATLSPSDAVKMQYRAVQLHQAADREQAAGDRVGALLDRSKADKLASDAALALDPVVHTTGRVTVGNGGEIAIGTKAMAPFRDMVVEHPDMLVIGASRQRMELADRSGSLSMALEASATINATNSLEKMLGHQAAAAHTAAMEFQAEARDLLQTFKRTGYVHQSLSIEAARRMNAAARMMTTYQSALLTLERLRNGGKQTVVVQHLNVGDGGQAVMAGQIKAAKTKRRHCGERGQ
jgi:hypothetical protein